MSKPVLKKMKEKMKAVEKENKERAKKKKK